MRIKTQEVVDCKKCGQCFAIFQFEGLAGWHTNNRDHFGDGECRVKLTEERKSIHEQRN